MHLHRSRLLWGLLALLAVGSGCKKSGGDAADPSAPLRLGFFPNITHAQALVGHNEGAFTAEPGIGKLEVKQFNAGPAAMEALVAGSLDVSYVGPGPAINTYLKAGRELRIISGAVNGGAVLVTTKKVLETRRPQVLALLRAHVRLTERWTADPGGFSASVNAGFGKLTTKPLPEPVLKEAFSRLEPSLDPVPAALAESARHAKALGYLTGDDISGLVDLSLLEEARGKPAQ